MKRLTLDDRLELHRYEAFRLVRHIRDKVCKSAYFKKYLTRVIKKLKCGEILLVKSKRGKL